MVEMLSVCYQDDGAMA